MEAGTKADHCREQEASDFEVDPLAKLGGKKEGKEEEEEDIVKNEIPYDNYAVELREAFKKVFGRDMEVSDTLTTAMDETMTLEKLIDLEGSELQKRFPIKLTAKDMRDENATHDVPTDQSGAHIWSNRSNRSNHSRHPVADQPPVPLPRMGYFPYLCLVFLVGCATGVFAGYKQLIPGDISGTISETTAAIGVHEYMPGATRTTTTFSTTASVSMTSPRDEAFDYVTDDLALQLKKLPKEIAPDPQCEQTSNHTCS